MLYLRFSSGPWLGVRLRPNGRAVAYSKLDDATFQLCVRNGLYCLYLLWNHGQLGHQRGAHMSVLDTSSAFVSPLLH